MNTLTPKQVRDAVKELNLPKPAGATTQAWPDRAQKKTCVRALLIWKAARRAGAEGDADAGADASPAAETTVESLEASLYAHTRLTRNQRKQALRRMFEETAQLKAQAAQLEAQVEAQKKELKAKSKEESKAQQKLEALRGKLKEANEKAKKKLEMLNEKKRIPPEGKFMSRGAYRKRLEEAGLVGKGQHVFHIIANANGGPDHTNNYLFTLGSGFNQSAGNEFDAFCCFIAGKDMACRAVAVALRVARNSQEHGHIEPRGKAAITLFTEGKHKALCDKYPDDADALAAELCEQGSAIWQGKRAPARAVRAK